MADPSTYPPPAAAGGVDAARLYAAAADAAAYYATQLGEHPPALAYLQQRGIADAAGSRWQLGYAPPGWRHLVNHLRHLGYSDDELYAAGLATRGRGRQLLDRFRNRLVFPIHDPHGHVVGFTARDLSGRVTVPKYINSPETAIYHKSQLLYGLSVLLSHPPPGGQPPLIILVEGAIDALAIWQMARTITDLPGTIPIYPVAPCGTALTRQQLQLLRNSMPAGTRLAVAFDADPAGRRGFTRMYPLLRGWPAATYAITLPAGADPADLLTQHGPAAALTQLAQAIAPATRTALISTLDQLCHDRAVTDPRTYPADRQRSIDAIAPYFTDDPDDLPGLAAAAADRLGLIDTDVVQAVIAHTFGVAPQQPAGSTTSGHRTPQDRRHRHPPHHGPPR